MKSSRERHVALVVRAALQAGWQIDATLPLDRHREDFDTDSAAEFARCSPILK